MQLVAVRQLSRRGANLIRNGWWIGAGGPSAGLMGAETDALAEIEDRRRLQAVRFRDLDETARQQVLALTAMMRIAEPTPFLYEAGAIFILRSQRCLSGVPWRVASFEAHAIVRIALRQVRALRPSWKDGQPIRQASNLCEHCGAPFTPTNRDDRFCSSGCWRAEWFDNHPERRSGVKLATERPCIQCGKSFRSYDRPGRAPARYCSYTCRGLARKTSTKAFTCLWCDQPFSRQQPPSWPKAKFCSRPCSRHWQKANHGAGPRPVKAASAEARDV